MSLSVPVSKMGTELEFTFTYRCLPELSLGKTDWQTDGRRMG